MRENSKAGGKVKTRVNEKERLIIDLLKVILTVSISTMISFFFKWLGFQEATFTITYLLGVMIVSVYTHGKIYGLLASMLSVLAFNFFFTTPVFTFYITHPDYLITFIVMFIASVLLSSLATKLTKQTEISDLRHGRLRLLDEINRLFINSVSIQTTFDKLANLAAVYFQGEVKIVVLSDEEALLFKSNVDYPTSNEDPLIITHSLNNGSEMTGSFSIKSYVSFSDEMTQFTLSVANQISSAMEKESLLRKQTQTQIEIREQRLRNSLLGAVSHDLRTPLATIIGSTDTILENYAQLDDTVKAELLTNIRDDAEWLIESVENILSFTRVEDGKLKMNMQDESIEDLVSDVISHVISSVKQRIILDIPKDLLMVAMDGALMEKVLLNLLNNASNYSPKDSEITLRVYVTDEHAIFEVCDQGPGIPKDQQEKIFGRFITGDTSYLTKRKGLGLGLSICKAIVEAHNGTIIALDNQPNGSIFRVRIPIKGEIPHE